MSAPTETPKELTSVSVRTMREAIATGWRPKNPAQLLAICDLAISTLSMQEHCEAARLEREQAERGPNPCEYCGEEIEPGSATFASVAHWSCHERATP
jgi:hypothetical protein